MIPVEIDLKSTPIARRYCVLERLGANLELPREDGLHNLMRCIQIKFR